MRARVMVALLLLTLLPLQPTGAEGSTELACPDHVALLPEGSTVLQITQNDGAGLALNVSTDAPQTLIVGNVTAQVADGVRAWSIPLQAATGLEQGRYALNISLMDGSDGLASCSLDVWVRTASALVMGIDGTSTFTVEESTRTGVAVNLTNVGALDEVVTFAMSTESDWTWGWTLNGVQVDDPSTSLAGGARTYIGAWIDVGSVENSQPLAGEGPSFTITASSSFDGRGDAWTFVLAMDDVFRVHLAPSGEHLTVAPGTDGRMEVLVTNIGNAPRTVGLQLNLLDEEGGVDESIDGTERFLHEGWTVALFGTLPDVMLDVGATRRIEVGFLAPWADIGWLNVRLTAQMGDDVQSIDINGSIALERGFQMELHTPRCPDLVIDDPCIVNATVRNTGNFDDVADVVLTLTEQAEGIVVLEPGTTRMALAPGQSATVNLATLRAHPDALAFMTAELSLALGPEATDPETHASIDLRIAPRVAWTFVDVVDERVGNTISISSTLRNDGNVVDGLVISMKSSHGTPMGLLPPENAIFDGEGGDVRTFELDDVPLGANISLRGWFDVPNDHEANGTVFVNLSVRSRYVPDQAFVHQASASYLGIRWQPQTEGKGIQWSDISDGALTFIGGAWHVLLALLVAAAVVQRAMKQRDAMNAERALLQPLPTAEPERVEDWMAAFERPTSVPEPAPSRTVRPEDFQAAFAARSRPLTPTAPAPDPDLADAASTVLDVHSATAAVRTLDAIAEQLQPTAPKSDLDALLDDLNLE